MIFHYQQMKPVPYAGDRENKEFCIYREREIEKSILKHLQNKHFKQLIHDGDNPPHGRYLIRGTCPWALNKLSQWNRDSLVNMGEYSAIRDWACIGEIQKFAKRKILFTNVGTWEQHRQTLWDAIKDDKGRGFMKTVEKDFSFDGTLEGLDSFDMHATHAMPASTQLMVSEFIDLYEEEYRTFVINHKPVTFSTYTDYFDDPESIGEVPTKLEQFAQQIADEVRRHYPYCTYYVMDVGFIKTDEPISSRDMLVDLDPVLIELNPITSAGRYIHNDFCKIVEAITGLWCDKPYTHFVESWDAVNLSDSSHE